MSTGKVGSRQVLERWDPGEYRKCGIRANIENVGSERVPKGKFLVSTGKVVSGRVPGR